MSAKEEKVQTQHEVEPKSDTKAQGGLSRRKFVVSVLATSAGALVLGRTAIAQEYKPGYIPPSPFKDIKPNVAEPLVVRVKPTKLLKGDLLVTDQYISKIHIIRNGKAKPFIDIDSWSTSHLWDVAVNAKRNRVYISMSGIRGPQLDFVGIRGVAGVVEVNTDTGKVERVFSSIDPVSKWPYADMMVDPAGLVILPDQKTLLVNDFNGFKSDGKILAIDLETGKISVFATGLMEPAGLNMDGPDHVLIGNARMPGGAELGGQIVRMNIHTKQKEVLHEIESKTGALIGATRLEDGTLVATLSDWPAQQESKVFKVSSLRESVELYQPKPGFVSSGITADGDGFWVGESLRRQLVKISPKGTVLQRVALNTRPENNPPLIERAFDTIESVKIIA
jgi:hypothetical protein